MRKCEYISPTRMKIFRDNPQEFYLRYLSDVKVPAFSQTQAMSVGSAFDAYVKSYLYEILFGKNHDLRYSFESLFEAQVEAHNREWAKSHGQNVMDAYILSGALADLAIELQKSVGTPKFELEIRGSIESKVKNIRGNKINGPILFLGKPDVFYINRHGTPIILDWKVNGYTSNYGASPMKGYVKIRDGWRGSQSKTHNTAHPDAILEMYRGAVINSGAYLDSLNEDWAAQLTVYSWLSGVEVGDENVIAIDQIACRGFDLRVAEHRTRVSKTYQESLLEYASSMWEAVNSDWIFRDMSYEQSMAKCDALDNVAKTLVTNDPNNENQSIDSWISSFRR